MTWRRDSLGVGPLARGRARLAGPDVAAALDLGEDLAQPGGRLGLRLPERLPERPALEAPPRQVLGAALPDVGPGAVEGGVGVAAH
jgi:hypothetical protein